MYDKVVMVSLDTLRADGITSNPIKLYLHEYKTKTKLIKTALDELISKSFFFNNVISSASYTAASHASYFTGLWPKNNGIYDHFNSKLHATTIFENAKQNGYKTVFKTDFPLILGSYLNLINGVDDYLVEDDQSGLDLLKKEDKVMSFFHFGQVHYPYGFHNLKYGGQDYKDKVIELENKYKLTVEQVNLRDVATETYRDEADIQWLYRYKKIVTYLYKNRKDNELFDLYLQGINYFHQHKFNLFLEKLLESLKGSNYLIVIFSDHGEAWSDDSFGHFNTLDEGVIRVPIILHASDIKPSIYSNRIRTVDLAPTLQEILFSESTTPKFDGISLSDIIYSHNAEDNRDAFALCWATRMGEIVNNLKNVNNGRANVPNIDKSVNFSACGYYKNFKCVHNYQKFIDRGSVLVKLNTSDVFDMTDLSLPKRVENQDVKNKLSKPIDDFNNIKQVFNDSTDSLREYFQLQGYNV